MPKYFFSPEKEQQGRILLTDETAHHIINVMRHSIGDRITLCNGQELDHLVEITDIKKATITCQTISISPTLTESDTKTTLYQALPKGDKLELIIQKCVELGVCRIVPVITSRSIVRKQNEKTTLRHKRIAESAASQSMRGIIPLIDTAINFDAATATMEKDQTKTIVAYEKEDKTTLKTALADTKVKNYNLWIGPEGGFTENEIEALISHGATPVTLGPRTLRTETAAIAMLVQVLFQ